MTINTRPTMSRRDPLYWTTANPRFQRAVPGMRYLPGDRIVLVALGTELHPSPNAPEIGTHGTVTETEGNVLFVTWATGHKGTVIRAIGDRIRLA